MSHVKGARWGPSDSGTLVPPHYKTSCLVDEWTVLIIKSHMLRAVRAPPQPLPRRAAPCRAVVLVPQLKLVRDIAQASLVCNRRCAESTSQRSLTQFDPFFCDKYTVKVYRPATIRFCTASVLTPCSRNPPFRVESICDGICYNGRSSNKRNVRFLETQM